MRVLAFRKRLNRIYSCENILYVLAPQKHDYYLVPLSLIPP